MISLPAKMPLHPPKFNILLFYFGTLIIKEEDRIANREQTSHSSLEILFLPQEKNTQLD